MSNKVWTTKRDILKDLAEVNGRRLQKLHNSDLIVGQKPPPMRLYQDENSLDELNLRFGIAQGEITVDEETKPDLNAIKHMLRVVNDYTESEVKEVKQSSTTSKGSFDITITKLNPNVEEFVPRTMHDSKTCERQNISVIKKTDRDVTSKNDKSETNFTIANHNERNREVNDSLSASNKIVKETENKDIVMQASLDNAICTQAANELKKTILMSNAKNPQMKKAKNVAIANLQKLLSIPNENLKSRTVKNEIKLITPDYYEKCKSLPLEKEGVTEIPTKQNIMRITKVPLLDIDTDIDNKNQVDDSICNRKKFAAPKDYEINLRKSPMIMINSKSEINSALPQRFDKPLSLPEIKNGATEALTNVNASDSQIQNSIKKVSTWLNETDEKLIKTGLFLNPVTFKRKDTSRRNSPVETEKKVAKQSNYCVTEQYKPSKYADELMQMYTARVEEKKKKELGNTWVNLDRILKEKDDELKRAKSGNSMEDSENIQTPLNV